MNICLPIKYSILGHHALLTDKIAWQWIDWKVALQTVKALQNRIVKTVVVAAVLTKSIKSA